MKQDKEESRVFFEQDMEFNLTETLEYGCGERKCFDLLWSVVTLIITNYPFFTDRSFDTTYLNHQSC